MLFREVPKHQTNPSAYGLLAGLLVLLFGLAVNASCAHYPAPAPSAPPTLEARIAAHYDAAVEIAITCASPEGLVQKGAASGVIVSRTRILTAAHVVEPDEGFVCTYIAEDVSGKAYFMYPITVLASDEIDLASMGIISVADEFPPAPPVTFGRAPVPGDRVCSATAWPRREYKCGDVMKPRRPPGDIRLYMTVEPGNSGGGLYDMRGHLVGIVVHTYPNRGNGQYVTGGATSLENHLQELLL